MNKSPRIAVIGAGISGLSCSKNLHDGAFELFVYDKSRGPAGRMSTRRGDGWQCDHGAQYFTARDPGFRAEVARWQAAGVAGVWPARLAVFNEADGQRSETRLERFVGVPRMTAPARFLADTLPLTAQTTITRLERTPAGWQITSAEHGQLPGHFDAVLLAVPAPQAVPLLEAVAPDLAAIAAGAVMRGSWALMLRYDAPVALSFDAAFVNCGPLRWIARDNSKPGRGAQETWLLHASAEWSEAHIEETPEAVAAALLQAFGQLGGPAPQAWSAHRWRYADTEPALDKGCVWDAGLRIGLCGDWLNGGKVEGAWLSGQALARQVAQSFGAA
ncbi:NAD(P)-binding protein [Zoogloea sp.]|uniref:NAD(P)/FAD-dependent oxidoreductase n=1 Tax=Zoogloea sp. TaxID=49181 RepID=UPI0026321C10|nr:NAD(P)-binding protein [Zoogloea sp.]